MTTKLHETTDREIIVSREFDAPRELVWEAMADPKKLVKWWGPRGFATTVEKMDFQPGGEWHLVMHGPDGTDYPSHNVFLEIVKPERIVFSRNGGKKDGPELNFKMTCTFDALESGRTRLTIWQVYPTAEMRDTVVRDFGAIEGAKETLARLAEELAQLPAHLEKTMAPDDRDFRISRVLESPRELVWKAWTKSEHMAKWWGPHDFTCPVCELDVRTGGAYQLVMRAPRGGDYPCRGFFLEVVEPERLVMSMDLSGHPDDWFDKVLPDRDKSKKAELDCVQTVTFEEEGEGKTKLTIRTRFGSKTIRDSMIKAGMDEGWPASFDRLAVCLAGMPKS